MPQNKKINMIVDLQFGSTGKGSIAGYIAYRDQPDTIVTAWSPNAGHTFIDKNNIKYVHTMLANGIVSERLKTILIGPGSVLNYDALVSELENAKKHLPHLEDIEILIHPHATIVNQEHRDEEAKTMGAIGSTKKGSGAALIEKLKRNPESKIVAKDFVNELATDNIEVVGQYEYYNILMEAESILIEGAQGFSLGVNSGFYPYCTSRECTPQQLSVDCALPRDWLWQANVIGTMRTFPIRVNNAQGYSGPCYPDQREINFKDVPCPPAEVEKTTVTQLPRRIFNYSHAQTREATRIVQPDEIFVNFMNYIDSGWSEEIYNFISMVNRDIKHGTIKYLGWGPKVTDIEGIS